MAVPVQFILVRLVFAAGIVAVMALGFIQVSLPDMRASDDNIWLYTTGLALTQSNGKERDPERMLTERVRETGAVDDVVLRYDMKENYRTNYFLPTVIWGAVAAVVDPATRATTEEYAQAVGLAIVAGAAISHGLAVVVLVFGVLATRRSDLAAAAFGGLALLLVMTLVAPAGAAFLFWELSGVEAFSNALKFALHPDAQYSVFGFTPRSQLGLIVLLAFIFRWRGWIGAGYGVLVLAGVVHQSMASFALAIVLTMDLALRPGVLLRRGVWPVLLLWLVLMATRETLWRYVLAPTSLIWLAVIACGVAVLVFWFRNGAGGLSTVQFATMRARLAAMPLYQIDAIVLGGGWLATLPLGYLFAQYADPVQRLYFWNQIHTRSLMFVTPAVSSALILVVWNAAANSVHAQRFARRPDLIAFLAVVAVLAPLMGNVKYSDGFDQLRRMESDMAALGRHLDRPLGHPPGMADEALIYLALAHQRDTGRPSVQRLLPGKGSGPDQ